MLYRYEEYYHKPWQKAPRLKKKHIARLYANDALGIHDRVLIESRMDDIVAFLDSLSPGNKITSGVLDRGQRTGSSWKLIRWRWWIVLIGAEVEGLLNRQSGFAL